MGVLTWDLMHLNKNGFSFKTNGGGFTGLVDETTFFNPIYHHEGGGVKEVEPTLEKVAATQYVEVGHQIIVGHFVYSCAVEIAPGVEYPECVLLRMVALWGCALRSLKM